jgi:uncharacterized RDD family membrane protein YckC
MLNGIVPMPSTDVHVHEGVRMADAVLYRRKDYVGIFRHIVIWAVDALVIFIFFALIIAIDTAFQSPQDVAPSLPAMVVAIVAAWWYLTVLKASRFRTPGYRIADAKIVTLQGGQPSALQMTARMLWMSMWLFGWPVSLVLDCVWITMNDERQMLRELFTETRLIRRNARPFAVGRISYSLYDVCTMPLLIATIRNKHPATTLPPDSVTPPVAEPAIMPEVDVVAATSGVADMSIIQCPQCGILVIPKSNGLCPSCQTKITAGA